MPDRDVAQIRAIAREFGMSRTERYKFGDFIEECKASGDFGSADGGDFTYAELRDKVSEFRGEEPS